MRALRTVAAAVVVSAVMASSATAAPIFTPLKQASVHPGVVTTTAGAQCTSNYLFTDDAGALYLGQAAHCSSTGGDSELNGCQTGSLPLGTPVIVDGATKPGTLAYNSWLEMQQVKETDPNACGHNDLALVKLDPADASRVNPSVPFFGGPIGITDTVKTGATVLSYGNSPLRGGIALLSPKQGTSLSQEAGGWMHTVLTVTPGVPGDSGSGYMTSGGLAFGVLSTIDIAPIPLTNEVGDLSRELAYANAKTHMGFTLVPGTQGFRGPLLKLGSGASGHTHLLGLVTGALHVL